MESNIAIAVLRGTPIWVFVLFAYLLSTGLKRLQPGVRPLHRMWMLPGVFIVWGLLGLFARNGSVAIVLSQWIAGATVGLLLGAALDVPMQVDRIRGLVWQPGSVLPLLRNQSIFLAHYFLQVAAALNPAASHSLLGWNVVVSGLSAGYFIGWALRFALNYAKAPQIDLAAPVGCAQQPAVVVQ